MYTSYTTTVLIVCFVFMSVFRFHINKHIRITFSLYGEHRTLVIVWRHCFYQIPFIINIREFQFTRLFEEKLGKSLPNTGITNYLCHDRPTSQQMCHPCEYIYWLKLAFPFILSYIYLTLILVNWTDTTEVGSNI